MKPAKKLKKFALRFYGPYSPDMFKAMYVESDFAQFDTVVIGTGESKAVAAARALSHLNGKGYGPVMDAIIGEIEFIVPKNSHFIEGDDFCMVYCVLAVGAER